MSFYGFPYADVQGDGRDDWTVRGLPPENDVDFPEKIHSANISCETMHRLWTLFDPWNEKLYATLATQMASGAVRAHKARAARRPAPHSGCTHSCSE